MLTRRRFVSYVGGMMAVSLISSPLSFASLNQPQPELPQDFITLCEFLTHKTHDDLPSDVILRTYHALQKIDPGFAQKEAELRELINQNKFEDVSQLAASSAYQGEIKAFSQTIIHAFYVGYIGPATSNTFSDKAEFITYTSALMYKPTMDATVIPSFSRGETNFWAHPPVSIENDRQLTK